MCGQGCILLTYLSVISSKFIQKFAQKCQYFTLIDQSVPLYNFYITFYLRTNQLCSHELPLGTIIPKMLIPLPLSHLESHVSMWDTLYLSDLNSLCNCNKPQSETIVRQFQPYTRKTLVLSLALLKKTLKQTLMRWKLQNRFQHQIVIIPTLKPQVYSLTSHWCPGRLMECEQTWVHETMNFFDFRIPTDIQ